MSETKSQLLKEVKRLQAVSAGYTPRENEAFLAGSRNKTIAIKFKILDLKDHLINLQKNENKSPHDKLNILMIEGQIRVIDFIA